MRPLIERGDGGSVVLTSSVAGLVGIGAPIAGSLGYTAAKHGLVGLMRAYANFLPPMAFGSTRCIRPGEHADDRQRLPPGPGWMGWLSRMGRTCPTNAGEGHRSPGRCRGRLLAGLRCRPLRHRSSASRGCGFRQQALTGRLELQHSQLDLQHGGNDHRLATVGLPTHFAYRPPHRLNNPQRVCYPFGSKRFQLLLHFADDRLQRLRILGEAPGMQVRWGGGTAVPRCTTTVTAMKPELRMSRSPGLRRRHRP